MKNFDLFPKVKNEYQGVKTISGGIITILTFILILFSLIFFIKDALNYKIQESLHQNNTILSSDKELWLSFNITVAAPCNFLQVYITDESGHHRKQSIRALMKQNLDKDYSPYGDFQLFTKNISDSGECGYCYGHEYQECCYTCLDVVYGHISTYKAPPSLESIFQCDRDLKFYNNGSKCLLIGSTRTPYAYGQLIISMNSQNQVPKKTLIDNTLVTKYLNLSHTVGHFFFGKESKYIKNPLDFHNQIQNDTKYHQYIYRLNLIHTYIYYNDQIYATTQYSAHFSDKILEEKSEERPGIIFKFSIYPINSKIIVTKTKLNFLFLSVCSIIGGGFMISSLIHSCLIYYPQPKNPKMLE